MTNEEARQILALYRPGGADVDDPFFAEAKEMAANDPELARWFAEQQSFDRELADSFATLSAPEDLQARIQKSIARRTISLWPIALAAAAILLAGGAFLFWRNFSSAGATLENYRAEMVSFIKLTPALELETADIHRIQNWLARDPANPAAVIPAGLAQLDPLGCRLLSFRGHKVTLICFKRGNGRLAHLLVVDRSALPHLPRIDSPSFTREGEWMTAVWSDGNYSYLLTSQGDENLLAHLLKDS